MSHFAYPPPRYGTYHVNDPSVDAPTSSAPSSLGAVDRARVRRPIGGGGTGLSFYDPTRIAEEAASDEALIAALKQQLRNHEEGIAAKRRALEEELERRRQQAIVEAERREAARAADAVVEARRRAEQEEAAASRLAAAHRAREEDGDLAGPQLSAEEIELRELEAKMEAQESRLAVLSDKAEAAYAQLVEAEARRAAEEQYEAAQRAAMEALDDAMAALERRAVTDGHLLTVAVEEMQEGLARSLLLWAHHDAANEAKTRARERVLAAMSDQELAAFERLEDERSRSSMLDDIIAMSTLSAHCRRMQQSRQRPGTTMSS